MGTRYWHQGPLTADDLYVERAADAHLRRALREGKLCYVLGPRQIGKSSLRLRTKRALKGDRVLCLDLAIEKISTADQTETAWYQALAAQVIDQTGDRLHLKVLWKRFAPASPFDRWHSILRASTADSAEAVVFFDEIDSLRRLPFADGFFAGLRRAHEENRAEHVGLTFCLSGTIERAYVIADPQLTALTNLEVIRLDDFTLDEARALLPGLTDCVADPDAALSAVLSWTSGQPYMTQRLFAQLVTDGRSSLPVAERVDKAVSEVFLRSGTEDPNLGWGSRFILEASAEKRERLLYLYARVLEAVNSRLASVPSDLAEQSLVISGFVAVRVIDENRVLVPRNRIFSTVFDRQWVEMQEKALPFMKQVEDFVLAAEGDKDKHVLRGRQLEEWIERANKRELSPNENELIRRSQEVALREQEVALREAETREKEAAAKRLRRYFWIAVAVVLGSAYGGFLLYTQREREREADRRLAAEQREREREFAQRQALEARRPELENRIAEKVVFCCEMLRDSARMRVRSRPFRDICEETTSEETLAVLRQQHAEHQIRQDAASEIQRFALYETRTVQDYAALDQPDPVLLAKACKIFEYNGRLASPSFEIADTEPRFKRCFETGRYDP